MASLKLFTGTLDSSSTPTKDGMDEVLSIITPEMKKNLFSKAEAAEEDEDSGIGMEFKKLPDDMPVPRFSALCSDNPSDSLTPDICFQIRRPRRRSGGKNSLLHHKRPLDEESTPTAKMPRCDDGSFKRSFSFGDQPCRVNSPLRMHKPSLCRLSENSPMEFQSDKCRLQKNRPDEESSPQTVSSPSQNEGIETVVSRLSESQDLIADGSRVYCLPTIKGQHPDLKCIAPSTMMELLKGKYEGVIGGFQIVDCRYPYEYLGGHIQGALNFYTHESILELLTSQKTPEVGEERDIIVFHCEFSSERAPKLCRFLRQKDREQNKEHYPALNYPELYILHGGYKNFYENYKEMCEPMSYTPMLHSDHSADLRHFRVKSKSWTAGEKRRYALKTLRF